MNPNVDRYLIDGCMRCKLGATPACKVNTWRTELETLRHIVLQTGLTEEVKWGVPCYTYETKNIVMVSAFKEFACLSFFKGALIDDPHALMQKAGESSQSARLVKFTSTQQILEKEEILKDYIAKAIAIEKEGRKVVFAKNPEPLPDELTEVFGKDVALKNAFYALTPGRQRGYIIYISQPKQSQSRYNRIEKCRSKIENGEGLNDKYSS